ncbi:MAG TPA: cytochrome c, partial [Casimicrobiaceae bacterium]|nr:cytochrome c [Casimicrobiaceae bacterium]
MTLSMHARDAGRRAMSGTSRCKAIATAVALLALAGCSSLERSRDVGDPLVDGRTLAMQVCSNCHGIDGDSISPNFPRLAGQPSEYLAAQLKSFRAKDRRDPAGFEYMWGLSRKLTDPQIDAIAAYFHAQAPRA